MTETGGAWQPSACILCECNCGIEIQLGADGRTFERIRGDKAHPASAGYTCNKALRLDHYQNGRNNRITRPLRRRPDGTFEEIDWDTAIAEVAGRLGAVRDTYGGGSARRDGLRLYRARVLEASVLLNDGGPDIRVSVDVPLCPRMKVNASNASVTVSNTRLSNACGAGCSPRSVNPNTPTVRDSTNPNSAPTDNPAASSRNTASPAISSRIDTANAALASTRNIGPM
jgi:hypothetical protein